MTQENHQSEHQNDDVIVEQITDAIAGAISDKENSDIFDEVIHAIREEAAQSATSEGARREAEDWSGLGDMVVGAQQQMKNSNE